MPSASRHYWKHIELFEDGQFVVLDGERVVAATSTVRLDFDFQHVNHIFRDVIQGGWLRSHHVSHDLKAPLRGIAGYAQELDRRHRTGLDERAVWCITQILTATRSLDRLIEDLLHDSRLDAETPSRTEVDLTDRLEAILTDRKAAIVERHAEVADNLSVKRVRTWERGLLQTMTNLIDNALK
jgi:signal transduction histidine kinase